jgi:hypothetical protein
MDGIYNNQKNGTMKNNMAIEPLTLDELMVIDGGRITKDTSFEHDLAYVLGAIVRGYYEFVTAAASFQSSLPANLKK